MIKSYVTVVVDLSNEEKTVTEQAQFQIWNGNFTVSQELDETKEENESLTKKLREISHLLESVQSDLADLRNAL